MYRRLIMASVAMVLAVVGSATAQQPEAPKVNSWSNSKTENQKTVFAVKPGEKITFTVKADGAEEYRWWVDKEQQKGAKNGSFNWTVPNKKGLWKIHVTVTNKSQEHQMRKIIDVVKGTKESQKWDRSKPGDWGWGRWPWMLDAVYPAVSQKEWIVSTYLKRVKPGESIQKAIDSVPPEGGIVSLAEGTYKIPQQAKPVDLVGHTAYQMRVLGKATKVGKSHWTYPYRFNCGILLRQRKNVLIQGAGREKTILTNASDRPNYHLFLLVGASNITFRDMLITANKLAVGKDRGQGVCLWACNDIAVSNVKMQNFSGMVDTHITYAALYEYHRSDNVVLSNCIFTRSSYGTNWVKVCNSIIKDSQFSYHRNSGVGFNSGSSLNVVTRCRCHNNNGDGINTYSNMHFVLKDNICYKNLNGIRVQTYTDDVRIIDNICRDNGRPGKGGSGVKIAVRSAYTVPEDIIVSNNLIYNNIGPGVLISCPRGGVPMKRKGGPWRVSIMSNTIFSNKGDGIAHHPDRFHVTIGNNIVADNTGNGISLLNDKSTLILSHNNVWNNAKGDYNGIAAGVGDFSKDPLFIDASKADFHLKSKAGRWDPKAKKWVKDKVHSPCIDAGDPKIGHKNEPRPNGGRVNIGAYGNRKEASKSTVQQK